MGHWKNFSIDIENILQEKYHIYMDEYGGKLLWEKNIKKVNKEFHILMATK